MVFALQTEGESISKLEKADVLELTVKHLRKLKRQQMLAVNPSLEMDRFRAGYTQCATEVSRCLASTGVDVTIGSRLMGHLGNKLNTIENNRQRIRVRQRHDPLTSGTSYHQPHSCKERVRNRVETFLNTPDYILYNYFCDNKYLINKNSTIQ